MSHGRKTYGEPKNEAPFNRKLPNVHPQAPHANHPLSARQRLHGYMTATAAHHDGWRYEERRPLLYPPPLAENVTADCSFACQILNRWAALPDPSGGSYDGYGNSVSMYHHLPHIKYAHDARVGDFIVFGPQGEWHATMVYEAGTVPFLWSFGHQGAPNIYPLSADPRRPITVLRNEAP